MTPPLSGECDAAFLKGAALHLHSNLQPAQGQPVVTWVSGLPSRVTSCSCPGVPKNPLCSTLFGTLYTPLPALRASEPHAEPSRVHCVVSCLCCRAPLVAFKAIPSGDVTASSKAVTGKAGAVASGQYT